MSGPRHLAKPSEFRYAETLPAISGAANNFSILAMRLVMGHFTH